MSHIRILFTLCDIDIVLSGSPLSRFRRDLAPKEGRKSIKNRSCFGGPFWKGLGGKRVPKGSKQGYLLEAFLELSLGRADFVKSTTVSHGMLTFACPGVPKRGPKSI